jgi:hypothetical protein
LRASRSRAAAISAAVCLGSVCASRFHTSVLPFGAGIGLDAGDALGIHALVQHLAFFGRRGGRQRSAHAASASASAAWMVFRSISASMSMVGGAHMNAGARSVHEYPRMHLYAQVTTAAAGRSARRFRCRWEFLCKIERKAPGRRPAIDCKGMSHERHRPRLGRRTATAYAPARAARPGARRAESPSNAWLVDVGALARAAPCSAGHEPRAGGARAQQALLEVPPAYEQFCRSHFTSVRRLHPDMRWEDACPPTPWR